MICSVLCIYHPKHTTSFPFAHNPIVTGNLCSFFPHLVIDNTITILNGIVDEVLIWNWWTWSLSKYQQRQQQNDPMHWDFGIDVEKKISICTVIKFNVRFCISSPSQDTFSMWRQTTRIFNKMSVRSLNIYHTNTKKI